MNQDQKQMEETEQEAAATPEAADGENAAAEDSRSREELLAEVDRLTQEVQDLQNRLLRTGADFDNFRKRARQEKEDLGKFGALRFVQEILPALDNFQLALAADTSDAESLKKGVEMVYRQLQSSLEKEGLKAIEAVGLPFDPNLHEAVMQVPSDEHASGTVVEELRKGYLMHERVIRPAMVKVAE
ncbi:nucleotide exchange factor GrpE [Effusibacillus dendaii]|uniref:Protein GrpE n=1 Tax=Effusibacillus dendaii TaxID=2743772 RepID=A0A7I8DEQ7_9BACL|nr:nucleotide exchange factor GrpE [Effusibacillus dendaii]BCJ88604.1 nucleotide exchange factor GrpE [Effusibacillus dendaii]